MNLREFVRALQLLDTDEPVHLSAYSWAVFTRTTGDRKLKSLANGYTNLLMNYPQNGGLNPIKVGEFNIRTVSEYDRAIVLCVNTIREYCTQKLVKAGQKYENK